MTETTDGLDRFVDAIKSGDYLAEAESESRTVVAHINRTFYAVFATGIFCSILVFVLDIPGKTAQILYGQAALYFIGPLALDTTAGFVLAIMGVVGACSIALWTAYLVSRDVREEWRYRVRISFLRLDPLVMAIALSPAIIAYFAMFFSQVGNYVIVDDDGVLVSRVQERGAVRYDWQDVKRTVALDTGFGRKVYRTYLADDPGIGFANVPGYGKTSRDATLYISRMSGYEMKDLTPVPKCGSGGGSCRPCCGQ